VVLGLLAEVAALPERVEEHERLLKRDSTNSSLPRSRDSSLTRQQRRALARERAKSSLRKQGGQPGHEGKTHEMAPPERVEEHVEHRPEQCDCGHRLDGREEHLGDPVSHQKWELPVIRPLVAEHMLWRLAAVLWQGHAGAAADGVRARRSGPGWRRTSRCWPGVAGAAPPGRRGGLPDLRLPDLGGSGRRGDHAYQPSAG